LSKNSSSTYINNRTGPVPHTMNSAFARLAAALFTSTSSQIRDELALDRQNLDADEHDEDDDEYSDEEGDDEDSTDFDVYQEDYDLDQASSESDVESIDSSFMDIGHEGSGSNKENVEVAASPTFRLTHNPVPAATVEPPTYRITDAEVKAMQKISQRVAHNTVGNYDQ